MSRDKTDSELHKILSDPSVAFSAIRSAAKSSTPVVKRMKVGSKVYSGENVADGMFDSLNTLKAPSLDSYSSLPPYIEAKETYEHIIKLVLSGGKMPTITLEKGEKILRQLRPSVMDWFSITSLHFLHLGKEGILHFVFLLNSIINHINSSSAAELNTIWAILLHKGGAKDPEVDRSWRTISCCPILAKAMDTYLVELYSDGWSEVQAGTQFQGENSSHELAALSITEAISHGLHSNKEPVYFLSLDALSAYDRVVIEHAVRCAYLGGTQDEGLLYLDNRLRSRRTMVEWDKEIVGPIRDTQGVEQGSCASDKIYRLVNSEQLHTAQESELGIDLGLVPNEKGGLNRQILSAVGFADDVGLLAGSLSRLQVLLHLTKIYCDKYQVKLVWSKTKLLVFTTKETEDQARLELALNTITVDGHPVTPTLQAVHVGVVRCGEGNGPNIAARVSAHRRAVYGVMHSGIAKGHKANPSASLKVETVFAAPVLLSGLACLVLTSKEEKLLEQHYKVHLQRLLRLHQATPAPVVYFLAGCLPLPALLHLRMFSLFGQLCRLKGGDNVLARHALNVFSSATSSSSKSWFWRLRGLCLQYGLPAPSTWLDNQPSKSLVKSMAKTAVLEYWLHQLRSHADSLSSLKYLQTRYMGLTRCHPLFRSCGASPWEVEKATCQARLLSGRYRVESLTGHWTPDNRGGLCSLPGCWGTPDAHKGTVECLLLTCSSLSITRKALAEYTMTYLRSYPHLLPLVLECLASDPVQFYLDCSTMPAVIRAVQTLGEESVLFVLFKVTRNYCNGLHKARLSLLNV